MDAVVGAAGGRLGWKDARSQQREKRERKNSITDEVWKRACGGEPDGRRECLD